MLEVLYFSDRHVQTRLFQLVDQTQGLVVVSAVRHPPGSAPVERREPFRSLEAKLGELVTFVAVVDEGSPDGMWRDPVGNLSDRLFPNDRASSYAAAQGYVLIESGLGVGSVRKRGDAGRADAWHVQEALAELDGRIPFPDPAQRPRGDDSAPASGTSGQRSARPAVDDRRDTPVTPMREVHVAPPRNVVADPFTLLGISRDTPRGEARKAFREKLTLYHPDKVAHLADEFRELAETRTRALMEAWEKIGDTLPD